MKREDVVEDALWMHKNGESPEGIAERLGISVSGVQQAFRRTGTTIPWTERRHTKSERTNAMPDWLTEARELAAHSRPVARAVARLDRAAAQVEAVVATERDKAELRARREELRAELASLNAELAGRKPAPASKPKTYNAALVRAWARTNGLTVADRGRIPPEVVAAYLAKHAA